MREDNESNDEKMVRRLEFMDLRATWKTHTTANDGHSLFVSLPVLLSLSLWVLSSLCDSRFLIFCAYAFLILLLSSASLIQGTTLRSLSPLLLCPGFSRFRTVGISLVTLRLLVFLEWFSSRFL